MNANLDAARAVFAGKSPDELTDTLRTLAADTRLNWMPSKFRLAMEAAAAMIERLRLTGLERQVIEVAAHDLRFPDDCATLWALLERTKAVGVG